jgi:SAM-dependent methyltransferase
LTEERLPAAERIGRLLRHLGIERAHFGAQIAGDLNPILAGRLEIVASLTLLGPIRLEPPTLAPLGPRLLLCSGDRGPQAETVERTRASLQAALRVTFPNYYVNAWSDTAAEHGAAILPAMRALIEAAEASHPASRPSQTEPAGEVAGVTYRVVGRGPALVLLPLLLAPRQWAPLIPALAEEFTVIVLGGAELGMVRLLETRGSTPGYLRIVATVVEEMALRPGEAVLDIGCGTGAIDRWLARRTAGANPIVAVDINPFLLGEARTLTERAGLSHAIDYREGNAQALPFADACFDAAMSHTVMEEGDADAMLAEMLRIARPGGRVGAMVRGVDLPLLWNVELPPALKARIEAPIRSIGEKGCADASLYRRFAASGLIDLRLFPHVMTASDPEGPIVSYYEPHVLSLLAPDEVRLWQAAKAKAVAEGTFFFARTHHCAVGTKPGRA